MTDSGRLAACARRFPVSVTAANTTVPAWLPYLQEITNAKDRLLRIDVALEMLRKDEEDDRERAKAYEAGKAPTSSGKPPTALELKAEATLQALALRKADIGRQKHTLQTSTIPGLQQKLRDLVSTRVLPV